MNNILPIFYHIPKNSGTYIYNCILSEIKKIKKNVRVIRVVEDNYILVKIVVSNTDLSFLTDKLEPKQNANVSYTLNVKNLTEDVLEKLSIDFISIEARGFRCTDTSLKLFFSFLLKFVLHKFIVLREPFLREQSLYHYLTSDKSKHERTHGVFRSPSFEEHIMSTQLRDSWLIRAILNIPNTTKTLTEENLKGACEIIQTFNVYDTTKTDKAIKDTLLKCFNIENFNSTLIQSKKNQNLYDKIKFEELSLDVRTQFIERKHWDQKLYNWFVNE